MAKQTTRLNAIKSIEDSVTLDDVFFGYGIYAFTSEGADFYVCFQNAVGHWIILFLQSGQIPEKPSHQKVFYAKGTSGTDTAWTNRLTLTYADFETTFN
jgi:hypothetical protein